MAPLCGIRWKKTKPAFLTESLFHVRALEIQKGFVYHAFMAKFLVVVL